ncbi:MAG: F0F1 ATP synthase subunit B' [Kiloniellales bacterium]|nr:F0F1 ATP synthase subunit B' [Kiloniellales bacterium]
MPQFNFATFPSQIFWLIVCFTVLYFLLARTALPKIGAVLEARQRKIDDDLERATELELQAKEALAAYDAELGKARDQAHTAIREAADEMAAEAEKQQQSLAAKLAADVEAAEDRIAAARKDALAHIQQVANEAARATTARLIGVEVDEAQASAAVAAAAKERG